MLSVYILTMLLLNAETTLARKCKADEKSASKSKHNESDHSSKDQSNDSSSSSVDEESSENDSVGTTSFDWDIDHSDWDKKLEISEAIPKKDYKYGLPYNPPITLSPPPEPIECRSKTGKARDCCYIDALWSYFGGKYDNPVDDCGCGMKIPGLYCRKGQDFIRRINWQRERLLGVIPPWIAELKNLTEIDVSHAQIWGDIPDSITTMVNMEKLWLYHTKMRGPIPKDIGNMKNLKIFAIHDCRIKAPGAGHTGSIPESITKLSNLYQLDLYSNWLTGSIPEGILELPLTRLAVHYNMLSGTVPGGSDMRSHYKEMHYLSLVSKSGADGNKFTGPVPSFYDDGYDF